eukprot:CAMPEP_0205889460 /NCGR_PEP_ID=MMETSP1083-20121108/20972_1 /ASSEMBLY_ACC=CAM_ASM_000430 /TAXON_ID=97485 /ORGANISM="Prymnesium parvum, Strain Texoma1" /LENGTH=131 /DNA_ID=CAMNT_0053253547 /DNA_START=375 /DNA_END=766 /DNA_ORIENTATION=-
MRRALLSVEDGDLRLWPRPVPVARLRRGGPRVRARPAVLVHRPPPNASELDRIAEAGGDRARPRLELRARPLEAMVAVAQRVQAHRRRDGRRGERLPRVRVDGRRHHPVEVELLVGRGDDHPARRAPPEER